MSRAARPAFIIPVHNRRETTLVCLRRLQAEAVPAWADIFVVDDGSTDGTSEAVAREFHEAQLLVGDGNLWWTGAIELGMRRAFAAGAECCVWLNDDTLPLPGACARLVATMRETAAVVSGQCFIAPDGHVVYGGLVRRGVHLHLQPVAGDSPVAVDAACGNLVAVPRKVIETIGFPDGARFPHAFGDSDYTLRARAAGFKILVEPRAAAHARPNALANYASWLLSDVSIADIWRPLGQTRSYAYAPAYARFLARHFGVGGAAYWLWTIMKRVPVTLLRLVVPQAWLRHAWGHRSRAWQEEQRVRTALQRAADRER